MKFKTIVIVTSILSSSCLISAKDEVTKKKIEASKKEKNPVSKEIAKTIRWIATAGKTTMGITALYKGVQWFEDSIIKSSKRPSNYLLPTISSLIGAIFLCWGGKDLYDEVFSSKMKVRYVTKK